MNEVNSAGVGSGLVIGIITNKYEGSRWKLLR
jgi:hypothetical protein